MRIVWGFVAARLPRMSSTAQGRSASIPTREAARLTLGVLGGLGPSATVDFLDKLIRATPANADQDHLRVLVDINPSTPDRNLAIRGLGPSPGPTLAAMAKSLHAVGADYLVMICNTAHTFEADIQRAVPVPFVSLIRETCGEVKRRLPNCRLVGLLATSGCLEAGVYEAGLADRGLSSVVLEGADQADFMNLIYQIKAGNRSEAATREAVRLADRLTQLGAELIVAACTELPLVMNDRDISSPLIDPTVTLARRCVLYSLRLEAIPSPTSNARTSKS